MNAVLDVMPHTQSSAAPVVCLPTRIFKALAADKLGACIVPAALHLEAGSKLALAEVDKDGQITGRTLVRRITGTAQHAPLLSPDFVVADLAPPPVQVADALEGEIKACFSALHLAGRRHLVAMGQHHVADGALIGIKDENGQLTPRRMVRALMTGDHPALLPGAMVLTLA